MPRLLPHPLAAALCLLMIFSGCAQQSTQPQTATSNLQDIQGEAPPLSLRHHIEASTADYPLTAFGIPLKADVVLQEFYLERNFQAAWHDELGRPTSQALALVDEIGRIGRDGLLPQDYHYRRLTGLARGAFRDSVEFDLLLSDAAANLSRHLLMGKVNPESIAPDWKATPRQRDLVDVMLDLTTSANVAERLEQLRPRQIRYTRLQKLLDQLDANPAPAWPALARHSAIKPNTRDSRVPAIRERLRYWGDMVSTAVPAEPEFYDVELQVAMRSFQTRHGLDTDAVIGPKTLEALNVTPAERRQQVVLNLERWRWLAEDLGQKHVLVNIAGFELKVIDNNETVMRKPVIVGRHYRRTPVFSDRIRYLVLNPTWTVPHKLAVKDKLPDIKADPGYLQRLGFTMFDQQQNVVDPTQVDWTNINQRTFNYRLVQAPGPQNALGQVKFMFPNSYDVYLHDTPSRELFSKSDRAFSSGCVRVAEPLDLAELLLKDNVLKDNGMNRAQIEAVLAKGELSTVFLKNPVPVHIEYWTAWIDSSSQVNFRSDIYERDPPLAAALAVPLYAD